MSQCTCAEFVGGFLCAHCSDALARERREAGGWFGRARWRAGRILVALHVGLWTVTIAAAIAGAGLYVWGWIS